MSQETPVDRLKNAAAWVAFVHAVLIGYSAFCVLVLDVRDYSGEEFVNIYARELFDNSKVLVLGFAPAIWLTLWITTGSPRLLPWVDK